ncbi:hypothetical protein GOP47_0026110 [Adiantum capillus-veneris]|uniref:VQ domain-containing protein n=1 Tax=Adiantum capillus-veneris TaxID=13818 RepID=A0A9D4U426_ADICA|nr:hypothetical protein GOP47_0026110 [Adiantum capillus-veneris]
MHSPTPAMDNWFISSTADRLLTQALTRELCSTSASSSSSSGPSLEGSPSFVHRSKYSDYSLLHLQAQSNLSQVGSPLSSDSECKEPSESPLNHSNASNVIGMSTTVSTNCYPVTERCLTHHKQAPQRGYNKAPQAPSSSVLSSQASVGAGASKVSKRRSRSNKKPPIAVLAADTSNFRAMVQQLTGIPAPQALPQLWGTCGVPLLKPQPTRLSPLDLTTLDTSSSFLAPRINPFLQAGHHALAGLLRPDLSYLQGKGKLLRSSYPNMMNYDAFISASASTASMCSSVLDVQAKANSYVNCATGDLQHPYASANMAKEGGHCTVAGLSSTSIESFLMDDEEHNPKSSHSAIDSWLAFDGGATANLSPTVDFTRIAS